MFVDFLSSQIGVAMISAISGAITGSIVTVFVTQKIQKNQVSGKEKDTLIRDIDVFLEDCRLFTIIFEFPRNNLERGSKIYLVSDNTLKLLREEEDQLKDIFRSYPSYSSNINNKKLFQKSLDKYREAVQELKDVFHKKAFTSVSRNSPQVSKAIMLQDEFSQTIEEVKKKIK